MTVKGICSSHIQCFKLSSVPKLCEREYQSHLILQHVHLPCAGDLRESCAYSHFVGGNKKKGQFIYLIQMNSSPSELCFWSNYRRVFRAWQRNSKASWAICKPSYYFFKAVHFKLYSRSPWKFLESYQWFISKKNSKRGKPIDTLSTTTLLSPRICNCIGILHVLFGILYVCHIVIVSAPWH